ncbi:hypothetical protein [Sphingomonas sp. R1]|uniref:hypothetical protein n=1 Tax=Sphingomonas sp. R1 TaxID=399176 RepID=UPI0022259B04|nr:hypothetical protein [Sphingomonas sp. R1]UYY78168.1 hypothetical protein OIM94_03975 [Sphingomonas sp. R1]
MKVRLAVVLTLAIIAAVVAWRSASMPQKPACTAGRHEERDAGGKVVRITHTECLR